MRRKHPFQLPDNYEDTPILATVVGVDKDCGEIHLQEDAVKKPYEMVLDKNILNMFIGAFSDNMKGKRVEFKYSADKSTLDYFKFL